MEWNKILCAVDGSEASLKGAEQARSLAGALDAELFHVCVIPTDLSSLPGPPLQPEARRALHETAEEDLEHLAKLAARDEIEARGTIIDGDPAEAIISAASLQKSDLIVLAARGTTTVEKWLLGGTTIKVLQHSPVPVLVTKGEQRHTAFKRILCGVDGSIESEYAVRTAVDLARAYGGEICIAHVGDAGTGSSPYSTVAAEYLREKAQAWIDSDIGRLQDEASRVGVDSSTVFLMGDVTESILTHASEWNADLIAVGSRGLGGFSKLRLGSTSYKLCEYADRSVLVTRFPG